MNKIIIKTRVQKVYIRCINYKAILTLASIVTGKNMTKQTRFMSVKEKRENNIS